MVHRQGFSITSVRAQKGLKRQMSTVCYLVMIDVACFGGNSACFMTNFDTNGIPEIMIEQPNLCQDGWMEHVFLVCAWLPVHSMSCTPPCAHVAPLHTPVHECAQPP
jgi:hypothetical protein